jgi:hypothetical protein
MLELLLVALELLTRFVKDVSPAGPIPSNTVIERGLESAEFNVERLPVDAFRLILVNSSST